MDIAGARGSQASRLISHIISDCINWEKTAEICLICIYILNNLFHNEIGKTTMPIMGLYDAAYTPLSPKAALFSPLSS